MKNPFEVLESRLSNIETLLLDLKHGSKEAIGSTNELLSISEAAAFLKLSVPTMYGYVHRCSIPYSKKGKRLYFMKGELENWIKSGRRKTLAEIEGQDISLMLKSRKGLKHEQ